MNKEVLTRNRKDNQFLDERELNNKATHAENFIIALLVCFYMLFKMYVNQPYEDILSISTAGFAVKNFYEYKRNTNKKSFLICSVLSTFSSVVFVLVYIVENI